MIANIALDDALILPHRANPCRIEFSGTTGADAPFAWQGRTLHAPDRAVRRHYRAADPWRATPSIRTNLRFSEATATIINNGNLNFNESSTAGSAIIANSNGLQFSNVSTAGSALINNGSNVYFIQASTGGTARLPADVQDKVFYWFETHSLGSPHRGTGLGLSLVRSFVQLHGGSVTLESAVGRGTTVTCVFPLAHTAERTAA